MLTFYASLLTCYRWPLSLACLLADVALNAAQRTHPGAGAQGKDAGARLAWLAVVGGLGGLAGLAGLVMLLVMLAVVVVVVVGGCMSCVGCLCVWW